MLQGQSSDVWRFVTVVGAGCSACLFDAAYGYIAAMYRHKARRLMTQTQDNAAYSDVAAQGDVS